jgi:hypothetical protein
MRKFEICLPFCRHFKFVTMKFDSSEIDVYFSRQLRYGPWCRFDTATPKNWAVPLYFPARNKFIRNCTIANVSLINIKQTTYYINRFVKNDLDIDLLLTDWFYKEHDYNGSITLLFMIAFWTITKAHYVAEGVCNNTRHVMESVLVKTGVSFPFITEFEIFMF